MFTEPYSRRECTCFQHQSVTVVCHVSTILQFCASWTSSVDTFSPSTGPELSHQAYSTLVGNSSSFPLYNNSTGYRSSSESCSKLLRSCTTFSINVLRHTLTTSLYFASVTPVVVNRLRSLSTRSAVVCRTRTQFGRRAFSVCGPDVWNSLPAILQGSSTIMPHLDEQLKHII